MTISNKTTLHRWCYLVTGFCSKVLFLLEGKIGFLVVPLDPDSNLPVFAGDIEKRGLNAVSVTFNLHREKGNN